MDEKSGNVSAIWILCEFKLLALKYKNWQQQK